MIDIDILLRLCFLGFIYAALKSVFAQVIVMSGEGAHEAAEETDDLLYLSELLNHQV